MKNPALSKGMEVDSIQETALELSFTPQALVFPHNTQASTQ